MADTEDFAVHRFIRELFEDLSLTLPSLGCRFNGTVSPNSLTVRAKALPLKNKLFLLFADLSSRFDRLDVRFRPSLRGGDLALGFVCEPFDESITALPAWDPQFEVFDSGEGKGFRVTLPSGRPIESGPPVRWAELERMYGDIDAGRQAVDLFLARCRTLLPELDTAVRAGDGPGILFAAHTLKGSARGVTALNVAEAALQLEMLGRSDDLSAAPEFFRALLVAYDEFSRCTKERVS